MKLTKSKHNLELPFIRTPQIYYVRWILPPYRAMTIPPLGIFVKNIHRGNEKILNHEKVHWKQYKKMGLAMFYFHYFKQLSSVGYDKMPMEMEARYEENDYAKNNYSRVYFKSDGDKI